MRRYMREKKSNEPGTLRKPYSFGPLQWIKREQVESIEDNDGKKTPQDCLPLKDLDRSPLFQHFSPFLPRSEKGAPSEGSIEEELVDPTPIRLHTVLGAGRVDPFTTYPVPCGPLEHLIMDHCEWTISHLVNQDLY